MNPSEVTAVADRDAQLHATLVHLSGLLFFFLVPLVVYLMQQDKSSLLAHAAREALNFQITLAIAWCCAIAGIVVLVGFFLMPVLAVVGIVFSVIAAATTARGERYRYPLSLRLVS